MDNTKTINILSLCTGYGGLELGLARALAGVFRVVAVEVEAYALANLAAKAQEGKLAIEAMWPDLKTFPAQRFRGCFDFILAGYPCQPFSVAGKRKGTDDPRHLWPHIARIVQAVRPVWCFFENVPGHLTIGFAEVYRSLRDMGYSVEAGLFTAAEVGAPHRRERLFILAKSSRAGTGNICGTIDGQYRPQDVRQENGQTCTTRAQPASQLDKSQNANGGRLQKKYTGWGIEEVGRPNGNQLANKGDPKCQNQKYARNVVQQQSKKESVSQANCVKPANHPLANADRKRHEKHGRAEPIQSQYTESQYSNLWPSRPGQPQYEWEEPRVVDDSRHRQSRKCGNAITTTPFGQGKDTNTTDRPCGNGVQNNKSTKGQAQSRLGRAVDGTSSRVDRLRLCGNGVSPQQAEKAFRELMRLFE